MPQVPNHPLLSALESSIAEAGSSPGRLKQALAIVVCGVALVGAVFLGDTHLEMHGSYHCYPGPIAGSCDRRYSYWTVGRAWWQIPAAIALGVVGFGAGVVLLKK